MLENQTSPPMNIFPALLLHLQYQFSISLGKEFDVEFYNGTHTFMKVNADKSTNESQPEEAKRNMTTRNSSENKDILGSGYAMSYGDYCIELLRFLFAL